MAPSARGIADSYDIAPDDINGGISAFDGESPFAAGGVPPAHQAPLSQYRAPAPLPADTSDDEDEENDETVVFRPPRDNPKLDPSARLSGYLQELTEVALDRFSTRAALQAHQQQLQRDLELRKRGAATTNGVNGVHVNGVNGTGETQPPHHPRLHRQPTRSRTLNEDDTSRFVKPSFVCPFYVLKPDEYRSCLKHDLRRIIDVKRHLWLAHRRPTDAHLNRPRAATWPYNPSAISLAAPPEAVVSEDQLQRLATRCAADESDEAEWLAIWDIVFHGVAQPPPSRIMSSGAEELVRELDLLRGFWKAQGRSIISAFLESKGIGCDDARRAEGNLAALHVLVLNRMVDKLVAGLWHNTRAPSIRAV